MIEVTQTADADPLEFDVTVTEGSSETRHRVTMSRSTCTRLGGTDVDPTRCIEAAFEFLLDREPKESILRSFDVEVISRYFPEFEQKFADYLT